LWKFLTLIHTSQRFSPDYIAFFQAYGKDEAALVYGILFGVHEKRNFEDKAWNALIRKLDWHVPQAPNIL
jgi:hypothetical protein